MKPHESSWTKPPTRARVSWNRLVKRLHSLAIVHDRGAEYGEPKLRGSIMLSFANRVVLVTAAGGGLGKQLALYFADEGAAVAGIDLTPEPLTALAAKLLGKSFAWSVADVPYRAVLP